MRHPPARGWACPEWWPAVPSRSSAAARVLLLVLLFTVALAAGLVFLGPTSPASAFTQIHREKITPPAAQKNLSLPVISSPAAIVIDQNSGRIIYSHNANARKEMASTTKIMTAVVVLESLPLDTKVTISGDAAATTGSSLGLEKGSVYTVEQLLYCLLVPSANDAAVALAQAAAGNVRAFVEMMNAKTRVLGLKNTHFANPSGLHEDKHFSSAKDLATLTQYAMQDPVFRRMVGTRQYDLAQPGRDSPRLLKNHNALLVAHDWVTGVKTGSTPYADYCLVASATRDGVSLISVLLGAADDDTRWKESRALLDYGFNAHSRTVLANRGRLAAELDIPGGLGQKLRLVEGQTLVASVFKDDVVTSTALLDRDPELPVRVGDVYGKIEYALSGKKIGSVDLVAAQSVEVTLAMLLEAWRAPRLPGLRPDGLLESTPAR